MESSQLCDRECLLIGLDGKPRIKKIKAESMLHDFRCMAMLNLVRAGDPEPVSMKLTRYNITSP